MMQKLLQNKKIETDGISILPTLLGKGNQQAHDYLYFEFHELNGRQSIRQGDWKLVHLNIQKESRYELYNLASDPSEYYNVLSLYPEKAEELKALMREAHQYDENWPLLPSEFK